MISLKQRPGFAGKATKQPAATCQTWPSGAASEHSEAILQQIAERTAAPTEAELVDATLVSEEEEEWLATTDQPSEDDPYMEIGRLLQMVKRSEMFLKALLNDPDACYHMKTSFVCEASAIYDHMHAYIKLWTPDVIDMMISAAALDIQAAQEKTRREKRKGKK